MGVADFRSLERFVILSVLDAQKDHLLALDHLKEGIGMRAYDQRDPLTPAPAAQARSTRSAAAPRPAPKPGG